jgi:MFS transporter, ACS family, tartrate transporter
MDAVEKRTMDKVTWRLVPFLIVCYFIAYLDRVNVGFANASMSKDLGLSAAAFGGAAGIFFIAYFFFEVPSNLALNRWRAALDCPDHVHLGHHIRGTSLCSRRDEL